MLLHHLVLVHHHPRRLKELLESLDHSGSRVVVHVDKKVDIEPFARAVSVIGNAEFVDDWQRVNVRWGGWSQVEATLRMLRVVSEDLDDDDYVNLISGDSYPLQEQDVILRWLSQARAQYISGVRMPSAEYSKPISRISRFRVEYDPRASGRQILPRAINKLGIPLNYRKALGSQIPYAGSQWWCLSGSMIRWMLSEIEQNRRFALFARFTATPDEFFFHTLVYNSPYRDEILPAVMYADWYRPSGPRPAVIDHHHVSSLRSSSLRVKQDNGEGVALFARKVWDDDVAAEIRRELWTLRPPALVTGEVK